MKLLPQLAKDSKVMQSGPGWILDRKWDGMRALFELSPEGTQIFSRTGQDLRPQFPELLDLHEKLLGPLSSTTSLILDGEIVALGVDGVEDLELLQMRAGDKQARRRNEIPVEVRFFDILEISGTDIRHLLLSDRRLALWSLLEATDCSELMVETLAHGDPVPAGWEGVVSKRSDSKYESGKRRSTWLKWKRTHRATLRVTGLTPGLGARASSFGAAKVADANGVHRGQVGSGFTAEALERVLRSFHSDPETPLLIEVEYRFLSKTGLMVNTAFKGFRDDKVDADSEMEGM